ncbi:MAG: hypothetical protein WB676_31815 [Bryobacteraceae bacterium]
MSVRLGGDPAIQGRRLRGPRAEPPLPRAASAIDFAKVFRFAPKLNAHQFRSACDWLRPSGRQITTDKFIEYLCSQRLASNVDLEEMRLPDENARQSILEQQLQKAANIFSEVKLTAVLAATNGFTGADLKRVVEDAKGLYAFDRASRLAPAGAEDYLLKAVEGVALNKTRYAQAETGAQRDVSFGAAPFTVFPAMGAHVRSR